VTAPGKTKRVAHGVGFFLFVVVMVLIGLITAAVGAVRDVWEDRHDA
jgi:hypothetical protein